MIERDMGSDVLSHAFHEYWQNASIYRGVVAAGSLFL